MDPTYFVTLTIDAICGASNTRAFREVPAHVWDARDFGLHHYVAFPAVHAMEWPRSSTTSSRVRRIVNVDVWNQLACRWTTRGVRTARLFNQVDAVPSLNAAYPALFMLFFWAGARWYWRVCSSPTDRWPHLVMGEHYVSDIPWGWFYASARLRAEKGGGELDERNDGRRGERRERGLIQPADDHPLTAR